MGLSVHRPDLFPIGDFPAQSDCLLLQTFAGAAGQLGLWAEMFPDGMKS